MATITTGEETEVRRNSRLCCRYTDVVVLKVMAVNGATCLAIDLTVCVEICVTWWFSKIPVPLLHQQADYDSGLA